jgi:hypothetical protein
MAAALRWVGFGAGVLVTMGTVVAVMKTLIVPRRAWSIVPALVGRTGFRVFHGIAVRMPRFDWADRFLGFQAPFVIIGILVGLLGCFVVGFALMLLPWADLTLGDVFREAGSSVFTLGFISTPKAVPAVLDVLAGATGMIFVALTIGYLPSIYSEVKARERLVRRMSAWAGTPSWGPEILSRFALAGALDRLPGVWNEWDGWCSRVADTHVKYPVLTHFRLPRSGNHYVIALLAVLDAAALDLSLRPDRDHGSARLLLTQGRECLYEIAYPMRRVTESVDGAGIEREDFDRALERLRSAGYPIEARPDDAWGRFSSLRSVYAPLASDLAYWVIAVPAPWSGDRHGFPMDDVRWPERPSEWAI